MHYWNGYQLMRIEIKCDVLFDESCPIDFANIEDVGNVVENDREFIKLLHYLQKSDKPIGEFAADFDGTKLGAAKEAFWEAVVNFTPTERRGAVREMHKAWKRAASHAEKFVREALEANERKKIEDAGKRLSAIAQESLESTTEITLHETCLPCVTHDMSSCTASPPDTPPLSVLSSTPEESSTELATS